MKKNKTIYRVEWYDPKKRLWVLCQDCMMQAIYATRKEAMTSLKAFKRCWPEGEYRCVRITEQIEVIA